MSLEESLDQVYIAKNIAPFLEVTPPREPILSQLRDLASRAVFHVRKTFNPELAQQERAMREYNEYFHGSFDEMVQRDREGKEGRREYLRSTYGLESQRERDAFEVVYLMETHFSLMVGGETSRVEKESQECMRESNDLFVVEKDGGSYTKKMDWKDERDVEWFEQLKKSGAQYNPILREGPVKVSRTWLHMSLKESLHEGIDLLRSSYITPDVQREAKVNEDFAQKAFDWLLLEIQARLDTQDKFSLFGIDQPCKTIYYLQQKESGLFVQHETLLSRNVAGPPREKAVALPLEEFIRAANSNNTT